MTEQNPKWITMMDEKPVKKEKVNAGKKNYEKEYVLIHFKEMQYMVKTKNLKKIILRRKK